MSKEHLWPDWLKAYIPRTSPNWGQQSSTLYLDKPADERERINQGDPHAAKLRIVCVRCNTGWMSRLQESAKPVLVPMLLGQPTLLYRRQQQLLARWAAMFVMTNEFATLHPEKISISQSDRVFVMERDRPPSNWRIWIGYYPRDGLDGRWAHYTIPVSDDDHPVMLTRDNEPIPNTQASSFTIGHLFVTVLSSVFPSLVTRWKFDQSSEGLLTQILPVRHPAVRWPPRAMNHIDADRIAGAFFYRGTKFKAPFEVRKAPSR